MMVVCRSSRSLWTAGREMGLMKELEGHRMSISACVVIAIINNKRGKGWRPSWSFLKKKENKFSTWFF